MRRFEQLGKDWYEVMDVQGKEFWFQYKHNPAFQFDQCGDLLTVAEGANALHRCEETVRSMIKKGDLYGVKIGRRYYIPKVKLMDFLGLS